MHRFLIITIGLAGIGFGLIFFQSGAQSSDISPEILSLDDQATFAAPVVAETTFDTAPVRTTPDTGMTLSSDILATVQRNADLLPDGTAPTLATVSSALITPEMPRTPTALSTLGAAEDPEVTRAINAVMTQTAPAIDAALGLAPTALIPGAATTIETSAFLQKVGDRPLLLTVTVGQAGSRVAPLMTNLDMTRRVVKTRVNQISFTAPSLAPAPELITTHVVGDGESLPDIAALYYGNRNNFVDIFMANSADLARPDQIFVGQRLAIPLIPITQ